MKEFVWLASLLTTASKCEGDVDIQVILRVKIRNQVNGALVLF